MKPTAEGIDLPQEEVQKGIEVIQRCLVSSPDLSTDDRHAVNVLVMFAIASLDADSRFERSRRGAIMLTFAIFAAVVWLLALVIVLCAAGAVR